MRQQNALADIVRRADTSEIARRMVEAFRKEIVSYRRLPESAEAEVLETAKRNVELFFDSLVEERALTEDELRPFRASARHRAAEGLPLEDLLHAYRLGGRMGWEALIEAARPDQHAALLPAVSRLMEQVDRVSDAVTETYHDWSRRLASEEERRVRDLLDGLTGELPLDESIRAAAAERSFSLADEYIPFALSLPASASQHNAGQAAELRKAGVLAVTEGEQVIGLLDSEATDAALRLDHHGGVYALGDPTPRTQLRPALGELRALVDFATRRGRSGRIELEEHIPELLLASAPRVSDRLRRRALEPLESYSRRRRADLLETLRTFVDCDLDRRKAADRLHVHPNTLDYRLRRVEELTGLRLASTSDLMLICLALTHDGVNGS